MAVLLARIRTLNWILAATGSQWSDRSRGVGKLWKVEDETGHSILDEL